MVVTLIHIGTSWWWQQNKCEIKCSDGRNVDPREHMPINEGMQWEIHETKEGIEGWYFRCSSGMGKRLSYKKLLIPKSEYSSVVHEGEEPKPPTPEVFDFVIKENGW
jgi:hypothetical protein